METTTKKASKPRIAQNAIYVTAGLAASGLLNIADLATATAFRDRFRSGKYVVPSDNASIEDLKGYVGVKVNDDGSVERPEVFASQGNGYDSYSNGIGGFLRSDTPYNFEPQGLGKLALIAIDALHEKALSDDETEANDAKAVLSALRSFDTTAATNTAERITNRKREAAIQAMVDAGVDPIRAAAILAEPTAAPVPVSTVETTEAPKSNKGKRREPVEAAA